MMLMTAEQRDAVEAHVQQLAQVFQRSSSCVEGRNGVLSFRHHELHNIGERKRLVLTALHNYFIIRTDRTTAAERFFESNIGSFSGSTRGDENTCQTAKSSEKNQTS